MEAKQYQGKSLHYLAIHPDEYVSQRDYPLIVLLHGFGANMHDLAGLCPAIDREGYLYACPNAPLPFQLGPPGQVGYGWTPPRGHGTAEDSQRAAGLLETFFDEVMEQYHVTPGQVILMGFSQGGGMTYRCGLGKPEVFTGLAALSSSMPDPEELRVTLPAQRTQPIFISHGAYDEIAPVGLAQEARAFLEGEGYHPQYKEYPMKHEISQDVMNDLVPWIKDVLPPAVA
jgi:phospholipase/carboxylesterase